MKKFTLLALVAMFLLPSVMKAESWTKEVSTKSELTSALSSIGSGVAGETYEIILTNDVADAISMGNYTTDITTGRVVIRSNETDYDKMPILMIGFNGIAMTAADYGQQLSLIFENVNLQYRTGNTATSGQIIYFNTIEAPMDTMAFRNCNLTNTPRTVFRSVPASDDNGDPIIRTIDWLEVTNCIIHDNNISSGNNWYTLVVGQFINTLVIENNMFYDIPYSKGIWQMSRVTDTGAGPYVYFNNNSVLTGGNKSIATSGFNVLYAANCLNTATTYEINNNIFLGPRAGVRALHNDTCTYDGSANILSGHTDAEDSPGGIVYSNNNVVDETAYATWSPSTDETILYAVEDNNTYSPTDIGIDVEADETWEAGVVFQNPELSYYYMLTSSTAYTAGVDGTYLGAASMYVDEYPVVANVDIAIDGPSYIDYTISPEQDEYYVGDEITITFNDHNSYYRTFNTFEGWSDGNTDSPRTITLEGDLALTATFTEVTPMIAAFDFSTITSNNNSLSSYDADLYSNMDVDDTYQATVRAMVNDTANVNSDGTYNYVEGYFQARPAKFGEDDEELQMPIISRRTAAVAKEVQHDYAQFEICTTGFSGINFSCFVGTDNNAAKVQAIDFSTDASTWTTVATVEIENGIWSELAGTLPEDADDKELIYVRVIGDISQGHIVTPDTAGGLVDDDGNEIESAYLSTDAFEYIGQVLISATTDNTGIREIVNEEQSTSAADAPVYNLMGIQVDKSTKGILIQNGKKFVNK